MKNFLILAFVIATINCSFLRQLAEVKINSATLDKECVNKGGKDAITMDVVGAATLADTKGYLKLNDTVKLEFDCKVQTNDTNLKCTKTLEGTEAVGKYTLSEIAKTGEGDSEKTYTTTGLTTALTIAETVELGTQTTSQEVDSKDDAKNSFTIVFSAEANVAPAVYANATVTTALAGCTLATDKKSIVCKPTTTEMTSGEEYKIHYMKGCTKTDTGITVKFSRSSFVTVSKVAMVILALLF